MQKVYQILILVIGLISQSDQYQYTCNATAICGCSSPSVAVNRIVGGETAPAAGWGWTVSIQMAGGYLCGGSILSDRWIITAAHCVVPFSASSIVVFAGSNTIHSGQRRTVSNSYVHPQYNSTTFVNDIALLRLSTLLNMSDPNVKRVCIPNVNSSILNSMEWPTPNLYTVAVGWGTLREGGSTSTSLQQVTLQIVSNADPDCESIIGTQNRAVQLCAGYPEGGKDTCQGDSGGPLMMYTASRQWVLVGLTSFGNGCARPSSPGIYTRVAYYQTWIRAITNTTFPSPVSVNSANINPFVNSSATTTRATSVTSTRTTTRPSSSVESTTMPIISFSESIHESNNVFCCIFSTLFALFVTCL